MMRFWVTYEPINHRGLKMRSRNTDLGRTFQVKLIEKRVADFIIAKINIFEADR